jgi:hypothetical protein
MNQPRDPDTIIATWLEEGPVDLPAETRRAIAVGLRTQPRARRMAVLGGSTMSPINRLAAAAAILLALGGLSAFVLANRGGGGAGATPPPSASAALAVTPSSSPPPSASPSASPTPAATQPSTVGWLPFTSSHYGYTIAYPPTWVPSQATRTWDIAKDRLRLPAAAPGGVWDVILGVPPSGPETAVLGFAADVPAGTTEDAWLASYYAGSSYCPTMPTFVPITVDSHPGKLDPCFDAQAFVFVGNRVYVFVIYQQEEQPLFRAFLSTVKLPASPSGSPPRSPSPS